MNGLCPACRRPYDEKTIQWKVVTSEEYVFVLATTRGMLMANDVVGSPSSVPTSRRINGDEHKINGTRNYRNAKQRRKTARI